MYCHTVRISLLAFALLLAPFASAAAQSPTLNVCADPDYLPYSNRAGQGFENKVAEVVGKAMGESVAYTWASYRGHGGFPQFLSSTLDAKKCDVVMNIPYGSREELTTKPYYISSYVFVFPKSKGYSISSMDSPELKKLRIGFERETPAEEAVKLRGMIPQAHGFDVAGDPEQSPAVMLKALIGGKIDVMVNHDKNSTVIRIADQGAGLSPEDLGRLFGRFQRLSAKPTAGESSTGLGLSIVKRIIDMHGGQITADSAGPGQGSTFTVVLPAAEGS